MIDFCFFVFPFRIFLYFFDFSCYYLSYGVVFIPVLLYILLFATLYLVPTWYKLLSVRSIFVIEMTIMVGNTLPYITAQSVPSNETSNSFSSFLSFIQNQGLG
jgi:hypothetical protein